MTTGEKIKQLRKRENLTQEALGRLLGVQKNAISKWERGRVENVPADKLRALAKIFDVPTSYLVDSGALFVSVENHAVTVSDADLRYALFGSTEATDEMLEEVRQYEDYLRYRATRKKLKSRLHLPPKNPAGKQG